MFPVKSATATHLQCYPQPHHRSTPDVESHTLTRRPGWAVDGEMMEGNQPSQLPGRHPLTGRPPTDTLDMKW